MKRYFTLRDMPKELGIKNPLFIILSILTTAILVLEFFYDLKKEYILRAIVLGFDVALLVIFWDW